jgi:hypothetical protein
MRRIVYSGLVVTTNWENGTLFKLYVLVRDALMNEDSWNSAVNTFEWST